MVDYLNHHNEIFFPSIKEPHYFCKDFPKFRRIRNAKQYANLYSGASTKIYGDASVWYLYSNLSAKAISEYNPDAKIIIMIRNPVEMLPSLHNQLLFSGREDQENFDHAWELSKIRRQGMFLPQNVKEIKHLFYDDICDYHSQIKRYCERFPDEQIKVIYFDDFIKSTKETVGSVVDWLGLDQCQDGLELKKVNGSRVHTFPALSKFIQHPPFQLNLLKDSIKSIPFIRKSPLLRPLYAKLSKPINIEKPSVNTTEEIKRVYSKKFESSQYLDQVIIDAWFNQG